MQPAFSIVITVFNKEPYIEKTLNCILNQSYKNYEVIIIDDGSTDNSLDIINSFKIPNKTVIKQENKGASNARNKGIKIAKHSFIALLDGDDYWESNYLKEFAKTIELYPNEFVYSCAIAHNYSGKIVPANYKFKDNRIISLKDYFRSSLKHTILTSSSVIFKKEIIKKTGLFNPSIKSGQDTDFWIRIGILYPIVFINKVMAYYLYNTNSLSNTTFNLKDKPKFDNYINLEANNDDLKMFLDKNRFSLALMSKLNNDTEHFNFYVKPINLKNLNWKQRILLNSPKLVLNLLLKIKSLEGKKLYFKPL